jgi:prepilin-type N-terminal cleavage/methylation domain-containing protein
MNRELQPSAFRVQRSALRPAPRVPSGCLRPAFTLVEMLVVITIIGILASLATVAAYKALESAKRARILAEIANIDSAFKAYKEKFGDYPPCHLFLKTSSDATFKAFKLHLAKCFPRCDPATELGSGSNLVPAHLTPSQALVFWLTSISKDPVHPLSANVDSTQRYQFFDFDKARLTSVDATKPPGWTIGTGAGAVPSYNPQTYHPPGLDAPFVYFEARQYAMDGATPIKPRSFQGGTGLPTQERLGGGVSGSVCMPLLWDTDGDGKFDDWVNPKTFQIISAGLDNNYGGAGVNITNSASNPVSDKPINPAKLYPTGTGYDTSGADDDNLTNFSDKQLGDAKP